MKTTTKTITGLSLAALLALTACGDGDDVDTSNGDENGSAENGEDNGNGEEASGEVFDFEAPVTESNHGPYDEVTIQVPDELLENEPEYAEERVLESVTLRGAEADAGQCAIEAQYNYSEHVGDDPADEGFDSTVEHDSENLNALPEVSEGVETEDGNTITEVLHREEDYNTGADVVADRVHYIYETSEDQVYSELLDVDFDEDAESYETVTHEVSCGGETLPIEFHTVEWEERNAEEHASPQVTGAGSDEARQAVADSGATWTTMRVSSSAFAQVEAEVDSEGNITLYAPGVDGWEYDNNGNWVAR